MDEFNPYAAPLTDLSTPRAPGEVGVWRDGVFLVMSKDAELPDRCIKCNAPAEGWALKRNLSWHPPGYYLIALFNLILYVLVAVIVRHTAKVRIPLCPAHRRRRRRQIALAWTLGLLAPLLFVLTGVSGMGGNAVSGEGAAQAVQVGLIVAGVVSFVTGLVFAVIASQVAVPSKIDKRFVWLKKVSPALLASLPTW